METPNGRKKTLAVFERLCLGAKAVVNIAQTYAVVWFRNDLSDQANSSRSSVKGFPRSSIPDRYSENIKLENDPQGYCGSSSALYLDYTSS